MMVSLNEVSAFTRKLRLRRPERRASRRADPHHRSIVVIDIAGYGRRSDPAQVRIRSSLDRVVRAAFGRAGMSWHQLAVKDRGDGMIVLIPAAMSKATLLNPFIPHLTTLLHDINGRARPDHQLHLRVAMHAGEVVEGPHGWIGTDLNLTCRLVDSAPLRHELDRRSDAELVLIVSEAIHRAVIRHGHRGVDPGAYRRVDIAAKEVRTIAWLYGPSRT